MFGFDSVCWRNSDLHIGSSLHSLGLSGHGEQKQPEKGWVTQHVSTCPGTSQAAQEVGGLPILSQGVVLSWDCTGFLVSAFGLLQDHPTPTWLLMGRGISEMTRSQGQLLTVDKHSWCHVCPEILTNNLLMVVLLMIWVERTMLEGKWRVSTVDDFSLIVGK